MIQDFVVGEGTGKHLSRVQVCRMPAASWSAMGARVDKGESVVHIQHNGFKTILKLEELKLLTSYLEEGRVTRWVRAKEGTPSGRPVSPSAPVFTQRVDTDDEIDMLINTLNIMHK